MADRHALFPPFAICTFCETCNCAVIVRKIGAAPPGLQRRLLTIVMAFDANPAFRCAQAARAMSGWSHLAAHPVRRLAKPPLEPAVDARSIGQPEKFGNLGDIQVGIGKEFERLGLEHLVRQALIGRAFGAQPTDERSLGHSNRAGNLAQPRNMPPFGQQLLDHRDDRLAHFSGPARLQFALAMSLRNVPTPGVISDAGLAAEAGGQVDRIASGVEPDLAMRSPCKSLRIPRRRMGQFDQSSADRFAQMADTKRRNGKQWHFRQNWLRRAQFYPGLQPKGRTVFGLFEVVGHVTRAMRTLLRPKLQRRTKVGRRTQPLVKGASKHRNTCRNLIDVESGIFGLLRDIPVNRDIVADQYRLRKCAIPGKRGSIVSRGVV